MRNRGKVWVVTLALMFLIGGALKTNAEVKWAPTNSRFISPQVILRDNLNDEFGPATDKLLKMEEEGEEAGEAKEEKQIDKSEINTNKELKPVKNVKLKVSSVIFTGNTVVDSSELNKLAQELQGKDIYSNDLIKIADEVTALYKEKGYVTSKAYFDPQNIQNGVAEIKIVESKIGNINIEDNKWIRTSYIKNNLLKANDVKEDEIFNINELNSSLEKDKYLRGEVTLQENKTNPEKTDVTLNIKDRLPMGFGVTYDNMGRSTAGTQRAKLSLEENNLTGFGDKLYANTIFARNTFGLNTGYNIPLGPYGTEFRFGYSYANVGAGEDLDILNIDGSAHLFRTSLIQPLYKGHHLYLLSDLTFDIIHSEDHVLDHFETEAQDLRVLRTGISGLESDKYGKILARIDANVGLPILGGSDHSTYGEASGKFFRLFGKLERIQNLPADFEGIVRLTGQYSPDRLPEYEVLEVGGMNRVRGFFEGALIGDTGYILSLELQRTIPHLPDFSLPYWPNKSVPVNLKDRVKAAAFYDQGFVHLTHFDDRIDYFHLIQSVGVGLRIKLSKFFQANMDLGIPIGRERTPDQAGVRFHFTINSSLI